jgi:hypothetical protein
MPARLRPPTGGDAFAVLEHPRLYASVGMRPTWEAERWEKVLGG